MKLKIIGRHQTVLTFADAFADTMHILFSYDTPVAAWVSHQGYIRTEKVHSRTTQKHITAWLTSRQATDVQHVAQGVIDALLGA